MSSKIFPIIILVLLSSLFSCSTYKPVATKSGSFPTEEAYINEFKSLAINEMKRTGIPASITIAQGIIESDMGRSRLAREANNHFGIKCHDDWSGPVVRHSDDRRNECFRKYSKPEESYKDHSDFLRREPRYKSLFSLDVKDYKGWARGLKRAGYATNPDYANMLIRKIEEYNLDRLDNNVSSSKASDSRKNVDVSDQKFKEIKPAEKKIEDSTVTLEVTAVTSRIKEKNRVQYIIVKEGDTPESLGKELQLLRWELERYNELPSDFRITPGQILYLQPKRDRADVGSDFHYAAEGETMYVISQIYGIKLKSLLILNRMEPGQNPVAGQKIWLRSVKPVD
jgi:hypothetical protein